jgi:hypothetical protein
MVGLHDFAWLSTCFTEGSKMKFPADECWGNRQPVCPYCSTKYDTEDMRCRDEDIKELQCGTCEKFFTCQVRVEIVFDTVGDCEKNNCIPHRLRKRWNELNVCVACKGEVYDWELEGGKYQAYTKDQYVFETGSQPAEKK